MTGEQPVVTVLLVVAMLVSLMRGLKEPVEEEECEEPKAGGGLTASMGR